MFVWGLRKLSEKRTHFSDNDTTLSRVSGMLAFSIVAAYLQFAAQGEQMHAFNTDAYHWRDGGKPDSLAAAERDVAAGSSTASPAVTLPRRHFPA